MQFRRLISPLAAILRQIEHQDATRGCRAASNLSGIRPFLCRSGLTGQIERKTRLLSKRSRNPS
jgi:hypothetical protein